MPVNHKTPARLSSKQRRLRITGVIVLTIGLGTAGLVYWMGTRSADLMDDPSMVGFNRAESRQMGVLFGNMGTMIEDFLTDLKRPGTQAIIIAAVAVLVALGCFYLSHFPDDNNTIR